MSAPTFPPRVPASAYTLHHIASQTAIQCRRSSSDSVRPKDCVPPSRSGCVSGVTSCLLHVCRHRVSFRQALFVSLTPRRMHDFPTSHIGQYCCGLSVCCFQGSCCRWKRPAPTLVGLCGSREPFSVIQMSYPARGFGFAVRFISLTVTIV